MISITSSSRPKPKILYIKHKPNLLMFKSTFINYIKNNINDVLADVDKTNKLTVEISVYEDKYKNEILREHQSKFHLPFYITFLLIIFKFLHYNLGILPIYYYSRIKKYITNTCYDNNTAEFVVVDF